MERSYPVLFLWVFALVTVVALMIAASVSGAAFNTYNPAWDGASELRTLAGQTDTDTDIVRHVAYYRTTDPKGTVVFVLAPETAYTAEEAAAIRSFVEQGGTLVVAGDFGSSADQLLADIGVASSLNGSLVRDERNFASGPSLPRATNVTSHPYTSGVKALTLNHGTVVRIDRSNANSTASALVNTSSFAYLDANGNGKLDDSETLAAHTVVSLERVGRGRVVVTSDASVFINAMLGRSGNRQFARNILEAHERAGIDVSHASGLPPAAWAVVTVRQSALAQLLGGVALVVGITTRRRIVDRARRVLDRTRNPERELASVDRAELVESLAHRYPHWDEERLRRVAQTLIQREKDSHIDE